MKDIHCWQSKFESCIYSDRLLHRIDDLNQEIHHQVDIQEVKKAIYYAKKYHNTQTRQTGEPYYSHPLEVAYLLAQYAVEEAPKYYRTDLLVTSILHDTIEDTDLTEGMILDIFGRIVSSQVEGLTRHKKNGKITSAQLIELLWQEKKYDLLFVKLLDRFHNLQTLTVKSSQKIEKTLQETFSSFLSLSLYLELPKLERTFIHACHSLIDIQKEDISQDVSVNDSFQLPSLNSQSKIWPFRIR